MATVMIRNAEEADEYAKGLTLDNEGLPPITEDPDAIGKLVEFGTQVGKDVFNVQRLMNWVSKRTDAQVTSAAGNNFFSSGPCSIDEKEFGKHAPDVIHAVFLTDQELVKVEAAVGTIGQRLRCVKKWGNPRRNPKTGKDSGGRYKTGAFGYWLGGVIVQHVDIPGRGKQLVKYRPTINMAAENSGAGQKTRKAAEDAANADTHEEGDGENEE